MSQAAFLLRLLTDSSALSALDCRHFRLVDLGLETSEAGASPPLRLAARSSQALIGGEGGMVVVAVQER